MDRALGRWSAPRLDPRNFLRGLLTKNVPLKVAAIAVALVAWLVSAQAAPEVTGTFEGKVPVERMNLPAGYVLRGTLGDVAVTYRGVPDAVRELSVSSFKADVDLAAYDLARVGELQELPVRVSVAVDGVRVLEVHPAIVAARLVPVESKTLGVQLRFDNEPPAGYEATAPSLSPAEVTVRGPADALREVAAVVAHVRFADSPNDVALTPPALAIDAAGQQVAEVEVVPQNLSVFIVVRRATPSRTVGVVPITTGQLAPGYWIALAVADPALVTVSGALDALAAVDHVNTAPVDVTGLSADATVRVPLVLPSGTSLARPLDFVTVTLQIRAATGTRPFPIVAVKAQNVRTDLVAELDPASVAVVFSGPAPTLVALKAEQLQATVDLAGKGPGTYTVDVAVTVPTGTSLVSVTPARITVVLRAS